MTSTWLRYFFLCCRRQSAGSLCGLDLWSTLCWRSSCGCLYFSPVKQRLAAVRSSLPPASPSDELVLCCLRSMVQQTKSPSVSFPSVTSAVPQKTMLSRRKRICCRSVSSSILSNLSSSLCLFSHSRYLVLYFFFFFFKLVFNPISLRGRGGYRRGERLHFPRTHHLIGRQEKSQAP